MIVYAKREPGGALVANRISVGANGSVPPIQSGYFASGASDSAVTRVASSAIEPLRRL